MVGEFVAHDSSPQFGSLNHGSPTKRNAPGPFLVRRLRTGADINHSSISAKCVENDPIRTFDPMAAGADFSYFASPLGRKLPGYFALQKRIGCRPWKDAASSR